MYVYNQEWIITLGTMYMYITLSPLSLSQLIADAGYQGEITSASSAAHQPEVFCGLIKTLLTDIITASSTNEMEDTLKEFCVSYMYMYKCACACTTCIHVHVHVCMHMYMYNNKRGTCTLYVCYMFIGTSLHSFLSKRHIYSYIMRAFTCTCLYTCMS